MLLLRDIDRAWDAAKDHSLDEILRTMMPTIIVLRLFGISEAVDVIRESAPEVNTVWDKYRDDFAQLRRFRDDAAHLVARMLLFQSRHHDARVTNPRQPTTESLYFDPVSGELSTGELDTQRIDLRAFRARMDELNGELHAFLDDQVRAGKIPQPDLWWDESEE
jgi:hypothetical protein